MTEKLFTGTLSIKPNNTQSLEFSIEAMPSAVNNIMDDLFERKYRKVGQEKRIRTFFLVWFFAPIL